MIRVWQNRFSISEASGFVLCGEISNPSGHAQIGQRIRRNENSFAFPEPEKVSEVLDGILYVSLVTLLELKLASGMTAAHRLQDMADVIQLIRVNQRKLEYGDTLDEYVRAKYGELWQSAQIDDDYNPLSSRDGAICCRQPLQDRF